jgi:hypothetical protein
MKKGYPLMVDIETWFANCQKQLSVDIKEISVAENKDWKIIAENETSSRVIQHTTKRLHTITFLSAWDPLRQEWVDRCLLEPIPEGKDNRYAIVLLAKYQNKYLVQAKGEPGNRTPHHVALTTTVQTSYTNVSMGLCGEIPFLALYDEPTCKKFSIVQDGGQLLNKVNEVCLVELENELEDIPERYFWMTIKEIEHFANKGVVAEHLMQTLGVLAFL